MRSNLWPPPRSLTALLAVLLLALQAGCAGYRLGSTLPPEIKSIFIPTFGNRSGEPLAEHELTKAAIEEFQKDGTLKIARMDQADLVLQCSLVKVDLDPLRYDRADRSKPNEYRLRVTVLYSLKRGGALETIDEGEAEGEATFVFAGNLTLAKKNALPNAAEDLAKRLVEIVVETW